MRNHRITSLASHWSVVALLLAIGVSAPAADVSVPGDFATIQEAIDNAVTGDRVVVAPATYPEALVVSGQTLSLVRGLGAGTLTIAPPGNDPALTVMGGAMVRVEEFILEGGGGAGATPSADGERGGEGLIVNDSVAILLGCSIEGGDGGDGSTQFNWLGGDGGHGLLIQNGALVCGSACTSQGGNRGFFGNVDGQILVRAGSSDYVFDAGTLVNHLLEISGINALESLTADSNGDGVVNVADAVRMVNLCSSILIP